MSGASPHRELRVAADCCSALPDEFKREVYIILGVPIDAADMTTIVRRIDAAADAGASFLVSTVNINFLVASQADAEFKESLFRSNLCTVDGMPVKWIAKLFGIPVTERTAGADLLEALKSARLPSRPLKVFLFGGADGAAAAASEKINAERRGLACVGSCYPGFGSVTEMSTETIIETINASGADVVLAALGAAKGQAWLLRNHARLHIPVRAHLGAAINIQAGSLRRAPVWMRKVGLEWIWRIKEEPQLWRRYWHDGIALLKLLLTRVGPLVILSRWHRFRLGDRNRITVERSEDHKTVTLKINGAALAQTIDIPLEHFQFAAESGKDVIINFSDTCLVDARFLGLLLMLDKKLNARKRQLKFTGITGRVERIFRLNGFMTVVPELDRELLETKSSRTWLTSPTRTRVYPKGIACE